MLVTGERYHFTTFPKGASEGFRTASGPGVVRNEEGVAEEEGDTRRTAAGAPYTLCHLVGAVGPGKPEPCAVCIHAASLC